MEMSRGMEMKMRKRIFVAAAIAALVIVAVLIVMNRKKAENDFAFEWKPGTQYAYSLKYKSENSASVFKPGKTVGEPDIMVATTVFDTTLLFKTYERKRDSYLLGVSITDIKKAELSFAGNNILKDEDTLRTVFTNQEAIIKINSAGNIQSIYFSKSANPVFENIIKMLLGDIQTNISKQFAWEAMEKNNTGTVMAAYIAYEFDSDEIKVKKEKKLYTTMPVLKMHRARKHTQATSALFNISLNRNGYLGNLSGKESVKVTDTKGRRLFLDKKSIAMKLVKISEFENKGAKLYSKLSLMKDDKLGTVKLGKDSRKNMLQQQSKSMTKKEMLETLDHFARTGKIYKKDLFLWRTAGFLKLHPEASFDLVPVFKDKNTNSDARMLIMGVLASVGHKEAQAAILQIIGSDAAKGDKFYPILRQNLAFIEKPGKEIVDYVADNYRESRKSGKLKHSSSLTLGAVTKRLYENGQKEEADRFNDIIIDPASRDLTWIELLRKRELRKIRT